MTRTTAKGAILGGITFFVWMNISWMGIGWHQSYMASFSSEEAVAGVLKANATQAGLYTLPNPKTCNGPQDMMAKMARGPFAYMMVRPEGMVMSMGRMMSLGFLAACIWCAMVTSLLLKTRGLSLLHKIGFVMTSGLVGSLSVYFAQWNWWGFSGTYFAVNAFDQAIGWGLVGLVLGKFVVRK